MGVAIGARWSWQTPTPTPTLISFASTLPTRGREHTEPAARTCHNNDYRTAIGDTVDPVPPWIFSGCIMKANS